MARKKHIVLLVSVLLWQILAGSLSPQSVTAVHAQTPVVRAILFYSPTCPHCHEVIQNVIPPLIEKYGEQLDIVGINVSLEGGQDLYRATVAQFNIPEDRLGVPTLIIGDQILVGSGEIPAILPGLIDQYLAEGGVDWPDIPGIDGVLAEQELNLPQETANSWQASFQRDPFGNSLSIVMLLVMVIAVVRAVMLFLRRGRRNPGDLPGWLIPTLALIGLLVATYLAYIETTNTAAICGPVGDCNTVQQSPYASLFGVLPIGILGMIGYVGILSAWLFMRYGLPDWRTYASLSIWALAAGGTLFSIYLTFLEPFVIGATCMWCLTSAMVMTLLFWATTPQAAYEWRVQRKSSSNVKHRSTKAA